jgi:hypothetical protein
VKTGRAARKSTVNYSNSVGLNIIFEARDCFLAGMPDESGYIDRPIGRPDRRPDNTLGNTDCTRTETGALIQPNVGLKAKRKHGRCRVRG